jgi:hypothetical protein
MGPSDRDYMHERRSKEPMWEPSKPVSTQQSTFWKILAWVSVLFLLYISFLWWRSPENPFQAIDPSMEVRVPEAVPGGSKQNYRPPAPQPYQQGLADKSAKVHDGDRTVTKCVVNGRVIFTDSDCPTGSKVSSVTVNSANVGTVVPQMPVTASPQVQYQSIVTNSPQVSTAGTVSAHNAECGYLGEQIKLIDSSLVSLNPHKLRTT